VTHGCGLEQAEYRPVDINAGRLLLHISQIACEVVLAIQVEAPRHGVLEAIQSEMTDVDDLADADSEATAFRRPRRNKFASLGLD
jgi:hypothetical protein